MDGMEGMTGMDGMADMPGMEFPFKASSQLPPTPHVLGRARAPR